MLSPPFMPMGAPSSADVHVDDTDLRDIPQAERDKMPASDFAGKGTSFPIRKPEDVMAAVHSIGRAGSDNYDAATLKRNIIRIAKRKGFPLPEAWKTENHRAGPDRIRTYDLIRSIEARPNDDGRSTSWIQVAKTIDDAVSSRYGKFSITKDNLRQMLANFQKGQPQSPTRIPVDYDHLSMDPQKPGDGIAAGWFIDLELREHDTELWGLVEWTPKAAEAIKSKEYQGVSPSFSRNYTDKQGLKRGTTLLAAAITNHPFLEGMAQLTLCADGDLALILSHEAGDEDMPEEIIAAGKSYTMKDVSGKSVEVPEDEMENCSYVKSLRAKLPKADEKVVKMTDTAEATEVVSLREKVTSLAADLQAEKDARTAQREEMRLDKAKTRIESLIKDGKALPAEKDFAIELAKTSQDLFDKWAGTHTKAVIALNREHGSSDGDASDPSDPVQHLTSLVAQEQKANAALSFEAAWKLACDKNPDAYANYREAVSQRV